MAKESEFVCTVCDQLVAEQDTFCKNCGAIFADGLACTNHGTEAEGVCVICGKPFCKHCGVLVQRVFFCDPHSEYEFQEGMARVFGTIDTLQSQYVTSCLEQAGLHPFLFHRMNNPGPGMYSDMVRGSIRNYGNHSIVEIKIMVPFGEVLAAEKLLAGFELAKE